MIQEWEEQEVPQFESNVAVWLSTILWFHWLCLNGFLGLLCWEPWLSRSGTCWNKLWLRSSPCTSVSFLWKLECRKCHLHVRVLSPCELGVWPRHTLKLYGTPASAFRCMYRFSLGFSFVEVYLFLFSLVKVIYKFLCLESEGDNAFSWK